MLPEQQSLNCVGGKIAQAIIGAKQIKFAILTTNGPKPFSCLMHFLRPEIKLSEILLGINFLNYYEFQLNFKENEKTRIKCKYGNIVNTAEALPVFFTVDFKEIPTRDVHYYTDNAHFPQDYRFDFLKKRTMDKIRKKEKIEQNSENGQNLSKNESIEQNPLKMGKNQTVTNRRVDFL